MQFYDFNAILMNGEEISMRQFEGQVVLVVNTASKCGLATQFEALENLYQTYKDDGFVVLGFPCDQFANQELDTDDDIQSYCQVNYGVTFPMFKKVNVNGEHAHPLWKFLRQEQGGILGNAIKWNFTKFLINRKGEVIERFAPQTTPETFEDKIKEQLLLNK